MSTRAREARRCPECGGPLLEVTMRMADGQVTYRMCPPCEARWWERDGDPVARDQALARPPKR